MISGVGDGVGEAVGLGVGCGVGLAKQKWFWQISKNNKTKQKFFLTKVLVMVLVAVLVTA